VSIITNGVPVPLRRTAVEVAMAATVELALIMPFAILVAYRFFFHKFIGPILIVTYVVCLVLVLASGLGAFGVLPY